MLASLLIVRPVFGLIGIGTLARQIGLVGDKVGEGLSDYVFALAVPCLIFRTLTRADIPVVQPWGYWISYFAGVAVVWWLAMIAARRIAGLSGTSAVGPGSPPGRRTRCWSGSR
jgi:predicted permease